MSNLQVPEPRQEEPSIVHTASPYAVAPTYHPDSKLWFYGNVRLLRGCLATVQYHRCLSDIEREAEGLVLGGRTLVAGVHNNAQRQAAIVPLRWGSPRIVVFSGGIRYHLGEDLKEEPFRAAKLWRYQWDARTDLAISLRAPDKLPTFSVHNPTVDRLIQAIARKEREGLYPSLSNSV